MTSLQDVVVNSPQAIYKPEHAAYSGSRMLTARMTNETDLVLGNMLDLTAGDVLLKVSDELNITQAGALTMLTESWRIGTSNLTMAGDHVRATVDGEMGFISNNNLTLEADAYDVKAWGGFNVSTLESQALHAGGEVYAGIDRNLKAIVRDEICLLYTSPSPRDRG